MIEAYRALHRVLPPFLATLFGWFMNAPGATTVFTARHLSCRKPDGLLGFTAAGMILVVAGELIPEAQRQRGTDLPTLGLMEGFVVMRVLDLAQG